MAIEELVRYDKSKETGFNGHQNGYLNGSLVPPTSNLGLRTLLDQHLETPIIATLGPVIEKTDIRSSVGPFLVLPEYETRYPGVVTEALGTLYAEYNEAFRPLVAANREWDTDYRYSLSPDGTPLNCWVQIDMVALPAGFLTAAACLREEDVREVLRGRIFEIENSLAMYQLLENLFSSGEQDTFFKKQFLSSLDDLRQRHRKPIALLAVTDQKYQAMRETEFGKLGEEPLTDAEVRELSGFDRFFGPKEFQQYVAENGGECDYLLFARTSDPVAKLRKPSLAVENPLLEDDNLRRVIKANAITFNVDNPAWPVGDPRRINDTKAYMPQMRMGYPVYTFDDLLESEFMEHLSKGKPFTDYREGPQFSPAFETYLKSEGIDAAQMRAGEVPLRAKPMQASYGGYGHERATLGNVRFLRDVRKDLRDRGPYIIQPEMQMSTITNKTDGQTYLYIDRNFLTTDGRSYRFMGGFRSLMPLVSQEADRGRVHGNGSTVWAEIL